MSETTRVKDAIDQRLAALHIDPEISARVSARAAGLRRMPRRGRRLVLALGALALCLAISLPVLAYQSPVFLDLLYQVNPALAQALRPVGLACEDQGVRMEVLAAMRDEDTTVVYLTMQDQTGDRIDGTLDIYDYWVQGARMSNCQLVDWDPDTKTGTLRMTATGETQSKVTVRVNSFLSHKEKLEAVPAPLSLAELPAAQPAALDRRDLSGMGGEIEEPGKRGEFTILAWDAWDQPIPGAEFVHITNAGVLGDALHIQTRWNESVDDHGSLYLLSPSGERRPCDYHLSFGKGGYGRNYQEYVFSLPAGGLSGWQVLGDFTVNHSYTEGKWQVTFPIDAAPAIACAPGVQLSPLGVSLDSGAEQVAVRLRGGSLLQPQLSLRLEGTLTKFLFETPLDLAQAEAVIIDGVEYPLP